MAVASERRGLDVNFWNWFWILFIFIPLTMIWAFALVDVFVP